MLLDAKNVLVVVAHPDDETLGAGGTIRLLANMGVRVDLMVVTDGCSAQFGDDMEARARRSAHLEEACDILGITERILLDQPDMRLDTVPHIDLNRTLATAVKAGGYDVVLTHHPGDVNLDHKKVFESILVVSRPQPGASIKTLATFFVNSSTEWGAPYPHRLFAPNLYVDIGQTIDSKLAALAAYSDELRDPPHPRSTAAVRARAMTTGSEVGVAFAEAFQLIRSLEHPEI